MHILVAEDEDFIAIPLVDNLKGEGYTVALAVDGEEALRLFAEKTPDLVLLDLLLPKRDGFSVLEELRKSSASTKLPVIIISNLGEPREVERAKALGATDYLIKSSSTIAEVLEKVKSHLEKGGGKRKK